MIELGQRLREAAKALNLSDSEVARRCGLSERRYGHYVMGAREPDFPTFLRICRILQTSPNELLGWEAAPRLGGPDRLLRRLTAAALLLSHGQLEMFVAQIESVARLERTAKRRGSRPKP